MLRPAGGPPISPQYKAQILARREQFKARVKRDYGVELNQGPFEVDTFPAHVLSKYAESLSLGEKFQKAAQEAFWLKGQALDNPEVLKAVMVETGLDPSRLEEILDNQEYKDQALGNITEAAENAITAVPALVFGNKYLVVGAQPYPYLSQVMEKLLEEQTIGA